MQNPNLAEEIRADVRRAGIKENTELFNAACVILAATHARWAGDVADLLNMAFARVMDFSIRLARAGIWNAGEVFADLRGEHGGVELMCLAMVATGELVVE